MGNSTYNGTNTGFGASSKSGSKSGYTSVTKTGTSNINFQVGGSYADLIIRDNNGKTVLFNGLDSITGLATGNYNLFVSKSDNVVAESGDFYRQKYAPTATSGVIWENTSVYPTVTKKYDGTSWVNYDGIFLGAVYSTGSAISGVSSEPYNSGNVSFANHVKPVSIIEEGTTSTGWYVLYSDGWIEQGCVFTSSGTKTFTFSKNMKDVYYNVTVSNGITVGTKNRNNVTLTVSSTGDCVVSGYVGLGNITRRYYKYQDNAWTQPTYNGSNITNTLFNSSKFAVTVSSIYDSTYPATNLFNGLVATGRGDDTGHNRIWESGGGDNNTHPWIKFTNPKALKITKIGFDFHVEWESRVPKKVYIYGMANSSSKTLLTSKTFNQVRTTQYVEIPSPQYFKGYYLYFDGSGGTGAYNVTEVAELYLTAYTQSVVAGTPTDYDYYVDTES